ncbi:MAG: FAD:protein FMN transferase, partial [Tidjanibacter sp.]|nr:FAD:protein FMN transferase [Tidjanibacter sp.]
LQFVGYEKLSHEGLRIVRSDPRVQIDLNSIAKGATVDMVARLVESEGVGDYLVDIGGEIFCRGTNSYGKPWGVGVETPFEGNFSLTGEHVTKVLRVSNVGMATSGNYRNYRTDSLGNKYTHIIDPRTASSTTSNLLSATVLAESCALADAYATMFITLGLERSVEVAEQHGISALFIYDDNGKMKVVEMQNAKFKIQN